MGWLGGIVIALLVFIAATLYNIQHLLAQVLKEKL